MLDEPFRRRFATTLRPIVPGLARLGLTPNQITVIAFVLAVLAAVLVATDRPAAALAVWLASRIGDGFDGLLARHTGRTSAFGGYLDITLDMAGYTAMVIGFAVRRPDLTLVWTAIVAGYVLAITTTLALSDAARASGRRISETDRTFQFSPALAEGGETTIMYALWLLLPEQLPWLAWAWVAVLGITALQRTTLAWRVLR